jgi:hypothetical protein
MQMPLEDVDGQCNLYQGDVCKSKYEIDSLDLLKSRHLKLLDCHLLTLDG